MALAFSSFFEASNDYGMFVYNSLWRGTLEFIVVPMHTTWCIGGPIHHPPDLFKRSKSPLTISLRSTNLPFAL